MFKSSKKVKQHNLFSSTSSLLTGSSAKIFVDSTAWHNMFYQNVLLNIKEEIFKDLFNDKMGAPNASIRILIGMMALKEGFGWSDSELFENCRFNLLVRASLGLINMDEELPALSTYYLLRARMHKYTLATNIDLMEKAFQAITSKQAFDFQVKGKSIRMDSKLIGSNIAWSSRYEIIHQVLSLFYESLGDVSRLRLTANDKSLLDTFTKETGNKVVYRSSGTEILSKLEVTGVLFYKLVNLFDDRDSKHYGALKQIFEQHYFLEGIDKIVLRPKEELKADGVQSPHDTDCTYRNKDGQKVKGYSVNPTETCDDNSLNLITGVQVEPDNTPDTKFLCPGIEQTKEVLGHMPESIHTDGAYHSVEGTEFCEKENINLYLNGIQGKPGQYDLEMTPNGLQVTDSETGEIILAKPAKNNKYSIKTSKGIIRYFTLENIATCQKRKEIANLPYELRNKRNNVEATIFQLSFHTRNNKTRYRGILKTKTWATLRCLWINLVRIMNHMEKICPKTNKSDNNRSKNRFFSKILIQNKIFTTFFNNYSKIDILFEFISSKIILKKCTY